MSYKGQNKTQILGSEEGYDLYADEYDKKSKFLDSFEKDELKRMLKDVRGMKILDVGCGTGRIISYLIDNGAEVVAADISEGMLKKVKKKFSRVEAVKADIRALPFDDESFDMVIAPFVIVHLKKLDEAFDEVYRVLRGGGSFIVTNINQRKAPKLKIKDGEIVIDSYYHIPKHVSTAMEDAFFKIEEEVFVEENGSWVNQILKGLKS